MLQITVYSRHVKVVARGPQVYFRGRRNFAKQTVITAQTLKFMNRNIRSVKFVTSLIRLQGES
jgi:hypothetical protein